MALDPYPSSRTPRAEESPLEPDRYGAHSIRLIGMSSLCLCTGGRVYVIQLKMAIHLELEMLGRRERLERCEMVIGG